MQRLANLSVSVLSAFALMCGADFARGAGDWQVAEAPLRFRLELLKKPTHGSAGYFVSLPDGGLLKGGKPATTVMTDDGKVLPSYVFWQNVEHGFALVFGKPEGDSKFVSVYIQPGGVARVWNPNTGLTPGSILCTNPGADTLVAAQAMAALGRVEGVVHWAKNPGYSLAALSISGDLSGRPKPAAFYQLSHVDAPSAGDYWVSPFFHTGQGELRVDGAKVELKEKSKLWGGVGASLKLTKGLHRVEVLQTAPGSGPYSSNNRDGGLMYLTWKTPNETLKNIESRALKDSEVAQSGSCRLLAAESRDGAPMAAARVTPGHTYWFGNEEPLLILEFSALADGYPPDARVTWSFSDGGTMEGSRVKWLVPGLREGRVKMTVQSGKTVSSSMIPYFGFSTQKTSLELAEHRQAFRDTLAAMLSVLPRSPDPVASWGDSWWNNIFRTVEGGEGEQLLRRLFGERFESLRKKLSPNQLAILEDVFLDAILREHPEENLEWLKKFFANTQDVARQNELRFREGELYMYYLNDRKKAEYLFNTIAASKGGGGERARIRLGDMALLSGDLNKATSFYADVQNRARVLRNTSGVPVGDSVIKQLLSGGSGSQSVAPKATPDLKGGALQEVSLAENVRTLTEGGFLLEAIQGLDAWEAEFPLSKISGDFILREAAVYAKLKDWKHARPMLEAYCREIDSSSYLPEAVSALISCVQSSKADPSSIRGIVEKVRDRLKFHPVATQLDRFLSSTAPASR